MIDSKYNPREIEESAQNYWEDKRVFESIEDQEKENITVCACFHTRVDDCIWDMLGITQLVMLYLDIRECMARMFCSQWDGMLLVYQLRVQQ